MIGLSDYLPFNFSDAYFKHVFICFYLSRNFETHDYMSNVC